MDTIEHLLREAADCLEDGDAPRAAWRVADAAGLLRERLAREKGLSGLDEPTGRGFLLPRPVRGKD